MIWFLLAVKILLHMLQEPQLWFMVYFDNDLNAGLLTEIPATEPPQLPGKCPESEQTAWVPFHGHCYYIESSFTRNWGQASLECLRMGECHVSWKKIL